MLNYPQHQTATEEVTAPCQPPSHTTKPMTAILEAPTTAPTEAAVAPLVRGLGQPREVLGRVFRGYKFNMSKKGFLSFERLFGVLLFLRSF